MASMQVLKRADSRVKLAIESAVYWHMKGDTNAEIRELYITEVLGCFC